MTLTQGSIRKTFTRLWLPMIGGIFAVKAIDLSDAFFIGLLGEEPLAAIGFTFPILMTLVSVSIGLSAGASSVLSRAIGEGASTQARQSIVLGAVCMAAIASLFISALGYFYIERILAIMGAKNNVLEAATDYMRIWFMGISLLIIPVMIHGMLRATGDSKTPAIMMTATAILNIALNPVFIFGFAFIPELGVQGAAVATVIARMPLIFIAVYLLWHRQLCVLSVAHFKNGLKKWGKILRIAAPASLSTSLNPIAMAILTMAIATIGTTEVAAFGLVNKIMSFALVPLLALSGAASPFCGQNSGAGKTERSRQGLYWASIIACAWSLFLTLFFGLFGDALLTLFKAPISTHDLTLLYLWVVPLSAAGYGILITLNSALNGLGHALSALALGGGRAIILLAPLGYLAILHYGFEGLIIATASINILMGIIAFIIVKRHSLKALK